MIYNPEEYKNRIDEIINTKLDFRIYGLNYIDPEVGDIVIDKLLNPLYTNPSLIASYPWQIIPSDQISNAIQIKWKLQDDSYIQVTVTLDVSTYFDLKLTNINPHHILQYKCFSIESTKLFLLFFLSLQGNFYNDINTKEKLDNLASIFKLTKLKKQKIDMKKIENQNKTEEEIKHERSVQALHKLFEKMDVTEIKIVLPSDSDTKEKINSPKSEVKDEKLYPHEKVIQEFLKKIKINEIKTKAHYNHYELKENEIEKTLPYHNFDGQLYSLFTYICTSILYPLYDQIPELKNISQLKFLSNSLDDSYITTPLTTIHATWKFIHSKHVYTMIVSEKILYDPENDAHTYDTRAYMVGYDNKHNEICSSIKKFMDCFSRIKYILQNEINPSKNLSDQTCQVIEDMKSNNKHNTESTNSSNEEGKDTDWQFSLG